MQTLDWLLGKPLATEEDDAQRVGVAAGVPTFGLDALGSAAYGPEAALTVLIPAAAAGIAYILPLSLTIIALLAIVYFSYRQTIEAYPNGGGSYTVAGENLGRNLGLLAAAALMLDYLLDVAVGISTGVGALISAVPKPSLHRSQGDSPPPGQSTNRRDQCTLVSAHLDSETYSKASTSLRVEEDAHAEQPSCSTYPQSFQQLCSTPRVARGPQDRSTARTTDIRAVCAHSEDKPGMVEAVVLWNEPNNLSHWDFKLDPAWTRFSDMIRRTSAAIREVNPDLAIVLGGVSSCDCDFLRTMVRLGVMDSVDAVGVHGFPLDWNHWQLDDWPARIAEAAAITGKPIWVTEVGVSSFGAEEVQSFGLQRTLDLISSQAARIHWYSLYDLPPSWPAETRHKEAEGSSYYRHYYLGLLRHDGTPKLAAAGFPTDGTAGLCQWFHFEDHRLDDAVRWMQDHGVRHLRTGLSWADSFRPNATDWFDRQMDALAPFDIALTLCFTPAHLGLEPHHTSPPRDPQQFADFAAWAVERYAPKTSAVADTSYEEQLAAL